MPKVTKIKKEQVSGTELWPENGNVEVDETEALEKAVDSVVSDLPERKRKKYERANWGDRPEHLRKTIAQMSSEEKAEYYRWKAGEAVEEKKSVSYEESEVYAVGCFILPMLCARMPNPLPPTTEELQGFGRVMTPLANKYLSQIQYKEEINAGIFALAFLIPRLKKEIPSLVGD